MKPLFALFALCLTTASIAGADSMRDLEQRLSGNGVLDNQSCLASLSESNCVISRKYNVSQTCENEIVFMKRSGNYTALKQITIRGNLFEPTGIEASQIFSDNEGSNFRTFGLLQLTRTEEGVDARNDRALLDLASTQMILKNILNARGTLKCDNFTDNSSVIRKTMPARAD